MTQLPKMLFVSTLGYEHIHFNQTSQEVTGACQFKGRLDILEHKIPPRTAKIKYIPLEELLPPKCISKIHPRIFIISLFSLSKNTSNIKIAGMREDGERMCHHLGFTALDDFGTLLLKYKLQLNNKGRK